LVPRNGPKAEFSGVKSPLIVVNRERQVANKAPGRKAAGLFELRYAETRTTREQSENNDGKRRGGTSQVGENGKAVNVRSIGVGRNQFNITTKVERKPP
jgi:hypothetical protein